MSVRILIASSVLAVFAAPTSFAADTYSVEFKSLATFETATSDATHFRFVVDAALQTTEDLLGRGYERQSGDMAADRDEAYNVERKSADEAFKGR